MSSNYLKTPLVSGLSAGAKTQVQNAVMALGKALSCHVTAVTGPMITVAFDVNTSYNLPNVTIPLFGPEYIRYPIKDGDLGYVIPVDVPVGFTSGQAIGVPDLISVPANLEALFFMPIGNINWTVVNPSAVTVYAPDGVVIRDTASDSVITLTPTGITIVAGGEGGSEISMSNEIITMTASTAINLNAPTINMDGAIAQYPTEGNTASLYGPLSVNQDVTANDGTISLTNHVHSGVETGSGTTGKPVA